MGPLARLQYTLEQHRNGTATISTGNLGATLNSDCDVGKASEISRPDDGSVAEVSTAFIGGGDVQGLGEDQSRLLPPVVLPQVGGERCRGWNANSSLAPMIRVIVPNFPFCCEGLSVTALSSQLLRAPSAELGDDKQSYCTVSLCIVLTLNPSLLSRY